MSKLIGTITYGQRLAEEDALKALGLAHLELAAERAENVRLRARLARYELLEKEAAVFTQRFAWINDGTQFLGEKIQEVQALQELAIRAENK